MRRQKRAVTDPEEIRSILRENKVCRVGMADAGKIYIVPMNFGYEYDEGRLTVYIHSAKVGRKIEALRENPQVCVELDGRHGLVDAEEPCSHSYLYASIIGTGTAEILKDPAEKLKGLQLLMEHQTGHTFDNFQEKWVNAVEVLKIELDEFQCKQHDGTN